MYIKSLLNSLYKNSYKICWLIKWLSFDNSMLYFQTIKNEIIERHKQPWTILWPPHPNFMTCSPESYHPVYLCPQPPAQFSARVPPCPHWCPCASYCPSHCCAVCGGWTGTSQTVSASPSGSPVQETLLTGKLLTNLHVQCTCEIRQQIQIQVNTKEMRHFI